MGLLDRAKRLLNSFGFGKAAVSQNENGSAVFSKSKFVPSERSARKDLNIKIERTEKPLFTIQDARKRMAPIVKSSRSDGKMKYKSWEEFGEALKKVGLSYVVDQKIKLPNGKMRDSGQIIDLKTGVKVFAPNVHPLFTQKNLIKNFGRKLEHHKTYRPAVNNNQVRHVSYTMTRQQKNTMAFRKKLLSSIISHERRMSSTKEYNLDRTPLFGHEFVSKIKELELKKEYVTNKSALARINQEQKNLAVEAWNSVIWGLKTNGLGYEVDKDTGAARIYDLDNPKSKVPALSVYPGLSHSVMRNAFNGMDLEEFVSITKNAPKLRVVGGTEFNPEPEKSGPSFDFISNEPDMEEGFFGGLVTQSGRFFDKQSGLILDGKSFTSFRSGSMFKPEPPDITPDAENDLVFSPQSMFGT